MLIPRLGVMVPRTCFTSKSSMWSFHPYEDVTNLRSGLLKPAATANSFHIDRCLQNVLLRVPIGAKWSFCFAEILSIAASLCACTKRHGDVWRRGDILQHRSSWREPTIQCLFGFWFAAAACGAWRIMAMSSATLLRHLQFSQLFCVADSSFSDQARVSLLLLSYHAGGDSALVAWGLFGRWNS